MRFTYVLFIAFFGMLLTGCTPQFSNLTFIIDEEIYETVQVQKGMFELDTYSIPLAPEGYEFDGWYREPTYQEKVIALTIEEDESLYGRFVLLVVVNPLEELTLSAVATADIELPTMVGDFPLVWESSDEDIFSHQGEYRNTSLEDCSITMRALIPDTSYAKEFTIVVSAYPIATIVQTIFDGISFPLISENVMLPTQFEDITASWSSSRPDIISSSGVFFPTFQEEEVTLVLSLSYLTYQETRTYVVITQAKMLTVEDDEYFALQVRSLGKNEDDLIMNTSQVDSFNQTVLSSEKTNTLDLAQVSEVTSKAAITTMINAYQLMDKYTVYHQSTYQVLSANDKIIILNNRNLNGIDEVVNIQYAVSTQHTNVRSYPTNHYANSAAVDRFQETGFGAGIPMIIYHQSLDQEWYFIRMFNYAGWVHQNDIALCNRAMFLNYVDPQEFIVVTDPLIMIGFAPVRMGTVLPIQDGQTVSFPTRNANGTLSISLLTFPQGSYHVGYLSLTYRLLFHQAYKLLGKSYSWGDKNPEGLDCSSTQAAIYGCFGFKMGRNTSNQRTTNLYGKTISSQAISSISSLLPGTLLYTSSHVLMLLGVDQSGTAWLLHNTTSGNICKLQTLQSYGTSSILYILEIQPLS